MKLEASLVAVWLAACAAPAESAAPARGAAAAAAESGVPRAAVEDLARMRASLREVQGRLADARAEKDVVKLNCLAGKAGHMKALLEAAEQSSAALRDPAAGRDAAAEWERSKIGIARTRMELLRAESERCIGQLAHRVDEKTEVEVVKPADR